MAGFEIVLEDGDHCLAQWHHTVICVWTGPATLSTLARMASACEQMVRRTNDATYLGVVTVSSPAPDEACRAALGRWSRDVASKMAKSVIVAEGGGFRAAMVRAVGTALTALVPHRVPFSVVGDVEEAVAKLAPALPKGGSAEPELLEAIAAIRARLLRT